jgi:choline kinase
MIVVREVNKIPKDLNEIIDVLIGEMALTRRRIESLLEVLDEKDVVSKAEFIDHLKKKTEEEKVNIFVRSATEV